MLLSGALLALFMTGFWLYCLTDAILTPAADCRGLRKPAWVALIAVTFIAGASAWLIVRRPVRDPARVPASRWDPGGSAAAGAAGSTTWTAADDAVARHPAGRGKVADRHVAPTGPDDEKEYAGVLGQGIRHKPTVS